MSLKEAIAGCSTGQIQGLSVQILEKLLSRGFLVKINHPLIICEGAHNNPYLQPKAYELLVKAVERRGKELHINSCLRTVMQQYMLRKQYEMGICGIRAAAQPGQSNHQSGMAIDIRNPDNWKPYLEPYDWKWLGSWDPWHFDFNRIGRKLGKLQIKEFQNLWNEYNPTEKLKPDGIWGRKTASAVERSPAQGFGKAPVFKRGDFSKEVGELQFMLRIALNLNAEQLKADCHFGAATEKYVRIFQTQKGLVADGVVGEKTMTMLKGFARVG